MGGGSRERGATEGERERERHRVTTAPLDPNIKLGLSK